MAALSNDAADAFIRAQTLSEPDKKALVAEVMSANPDLFPSNDKYRTWLWLMLLGGLFLIALTAIICGVILAKSDNDATAVIALASAVVAGAIGLFANPPTSSAR